MKSIVRIVPVFLSVFLFPPGQATIITESYDFGTDPGKTTFAAAGFTARYASGNALDVADSADGVRFLRNDAGAHQTLGIVKQFTGLGGANTESFTITMTGRYFQFGTFNRPIGVALFADNPTSLRTSGVYAGLDAGKIEIRSNGNNGSIETDAVLLSDFAASELLTFTVHGVYDATDLQLQVVLSDGTATQSLTHSYSLAGNATIDGTYFGASARVSTATPPVLFGEVDTFSVAAIPEPSTLVLLAGSALVVLANRRRRQG